jgi:hypothetical protein
MRFAAYIAATLTLACISVAAVRISIIYFGLPDWLGFGAGIVITAAILEITHPVRRKLIP